MISVTELKQTCRACPSQWEGVTRGGKIIYIRFRWGKLFVGIGPDIKSAVDNSSDNVVYDDGSGLVGYMDEKMMKRLAHIRLIKR
jgi:hypothetical protein